MQAGKEIGEKTQGIEKLPALSQDREAELNHSMD